MFADPKSLVSPLLFCIALCGIRDVHAEASPEVYALSEELALYILEVAPGAIRYGDDEWASVEYKLQTFLDRGADPDLYIHKARGSALGSTMVLGGGERLFFLVAPYVKNFSKPHARKAFPIEQAFRYRSFEVMKYLVANGADINGRKCCDDITFRPFIHRAVSSNDLEMIEFLLELGADINIKNSRFNALRLAIVKKHYELVPILIERGANGGGFSILHDAISRDAPSEILQAVLQLGYGAASVDQFGRTARDHAEQLGKYDALKFLDSIGR